MSEMTDAAEGSTGFGDQSLGLINLAQKLHDEFVNEAKVKAKEIREEAQIEHDNLISEATSRSNELMDEAEQYADTLSKNSENEAAAIVSEAREQAREVLEKVELTRVEIEESLVKLQRFEYEYRNSLRTLVEGASLTLGLPEIVEPEVDDDVEYSEDLEDAVDAVQTEQLSQIVAESLPEELEIVQSHVDASEEINIQSLVTAAVRENPENILVGEVRDNDSFTTLAMLEVIEDEDDFSNESELDDDAVEEIVSDEVYEDSDESLADASVETDSESEEVLDDSVIDEKLEEVNVADPFVGFPKPSRDLANEVFSSSDPLAALKAAMASTPEENLEDNEISEDSEESNNLPFSLEGLYAPNPENRSVNLDDDDEEKK